MMRFCRFISNSYYVELCNARHAVEFHCRPLPTTAKAARFPLSAGIAATGSRC
jgi:hypothetical protein